MQFPGVAVVGAFGRLGSAFVLKVESEERGQMSAERIIRLEREQVAIVQDEKPLRIVAGEVENGLACGAESVGAANRDYVPEKISKGIRYAGGRGIHKLRVLPRSAITQQIVPV